jgi:hypothetical protein
MSKFAFLFLVLFSFSNIAVSDENDVRFFYSGFDFHIPKGATVIGTEGSQDNFTFFRFGNRKGKEYLAFTDITNESVDYGCSTQQFFSHLAGISGPSTCSSQEIDSFKKIFVSNSDVGEWSGKSLTSYYFFSDSKSFLYVFGENKIIKIESDFISKSDLKNVIKDYL